MKKTIITMMLLTAFPVFAQSVAVTQPSPNAPVQPVLTISANAVTALGSNTTNRVFVDQSGENPDVSITQTGVGNTVGANATYTKGITNIPQRLVGGGTRNFTVDTPMYLRGADQDITVVQTGNNNTVSLRAENPTSSGDGVSINIQQIGDSNFVDASCGGGSSSTGTALTTCKDATISWKWTGNSNVMQFKGTGDSLNSQVEVTGNSNEMYIDAVGDKHSQVIKVAGDYNVFNISQTANSTNGSSVWIDLTGNSNKFAISQAGTQDNVIHIKSVANTGNWNIVQRTTQ
jgi:hypothetical protein